MKTNYSKFYIKFIVALTIIFATSQTYTYAMPGAGAPCVISGTPTNLGVVAAGDDCASAGSLGALDVPCACDGGTIVPTQVSGSTVGATAEDPYGTIINCGGIIGNDMASPAADVWYTFDVSGNSLNLDIVSTMSEVSIGIYSDPGGGCGALTPLGCANDASGSLSTVFENIIPGQTVYVQISGADESDFGDFTLTLSNDVSCFACILANDLTINPAPINGTYQGGQTVDFCYSVTDYSQENTNWLHGIVPVFGSGWDMGTLVVNPPGTCEATGVGTWGWFTNIPTPSDGNVDGFFFDGDQINGPPDGDPTNNFGDDCGAGSPNGNFVVSGWDFCWSINTQDCIEGGDLGISVLNYADGETGSWTDLACELDYTFNFASSITCCPPSIVSSTPTCAATCDGTATVDGLGALGTGTGPWDYTWEDALGTIISSNTGVNGPETLTNLCAGTYTITVTDANACVTVIDVTVVGIPMPVLTVQDTATCSPNTIDLTDGTYWSTDVGAITYFESDGTTVVGDPTAVSTGTYIISANNAGCITTAPVVVTVNTTPVIVAAGVGPFTCNATDGEIEVTLSSGPTSSGTLSWTGTASGSNGSADITADSPDITGLGFGTYNVTFTDANGCVSNTEVEVLINPGAPVIDPISSIFSCADYDLVLANVTGTNLNTTGALTFYALTGGPLAPGQVVVNDQTFTAFTNTTIFVYDENGACSHEIQFDITINTTPTLTVQDTTTCSPNTVDLTDVTYWSTDVGTITYFESDGTTVVADETAVGAGTYILSADNAGCITTAPVVVTVNTTPTLTLVDPAPVCSPATVDITAGAVSSTDVGTMLYYSDVALTILVPDATAVGAGTYYVEATNLSCTSNGSVNVTVNTTPTLTLVDPAPVCSPATVDITAGAVSSTDVGTMLYYTDPGMTILVPDATTVGAGTYYIEATNLGCTSSGSVTVVSIMPPDVDPQAAVAVCNTYALPVITGTALTGAQAYYDASGGLGNIVTGPVTSSTTLFVYDGVAGCSDEEILIITINPTPAAPVAGTDTEYCATITPDAMTASGGTGTFTWYSDAGLTLILGTGITLDPSNAIGVTTYYVTETEFGCEGPASQVNISFIGCDITVPTAFTPDGDGMNDDWEILDIDLTYPNNIVYVYNRWGNLLFTSEQGQYDTNRWDGTHNGELLPIGSYYFIIEFNNEASETATGIVSIILNK